MSAHHGVPSSFRPFTGSSAGSKGYARPKSARRGARSVQPPLTAQAAPPEIERHRDAPDRTSEDAEHMQHFDTDCGQRAARPWEGMKARRTDVLHGAWFACAATKRGCNLPYEGQPSQCWANTTGECLRMSRACFPLSV